ncbi:MAG: stage II sporulation protein D [Firmicutes bacterium]|nr:stage II sporulation protein D [Bacillota bacterium]
MDRYGRKIAAGIGLSLLFNLILLVLIPVLIFFIFTLFSFVSLSDEDDNIDLVEIPDYINVYITDEEKVRKIRFEEYIKGVVASEMPSSFELEALKAQAVAARTYSLSKIVRSGDDGNPEVHPDAPLCDTVHCQVYRDKESLAALKGDDWMADGYRKIEKAVEGTSGEVMYYQGELVAQALFHSSSGGKTENSEDVFASAVPYLRSVSSPYEEGATHYGEEKTFTYPELTSSLNSIYTDRFAGNISSGDINIKSRTEGGRVDEIIIGNASYSGREIREVLGLSSANFDIKLSDAGITFTTFGYGHGVGMSQYGANGMAKEGEKYKEILMHYYTGIVVK